MARKFSSDYGYYKSVFIRMEPGDGNTDDILDLRRDILGLLPTSFSVSTGEGRFCHADTISFNCLADVSLRRIPEGVVVTVSVSKYIRDEYTRNGNPRYINLAIPYINKLCLRLFADLSGMYTLETTIPERH